MRARSAEQGVAWSLVFFTVLTQAAAGLYVAATLLGFVVRVRGATWEVSSGVISWTSFGLFALGGLAAATHLGRPLAARHVGANLGSSWLSREALLGAAFGVGLLLGLVPGLGTVHAVVTSALGLAFVYAITRVYRVRTVPAWDDGTTPASFFGTTILLGAALLALLLPRLAGYGGANPEWLRGTLRALAVVVLLTALAQLVVANVRQHRFPAKDGTGGLSRREHRLVLAVRVTALLLGAALLFVIAWWGPVAGRSPTPSFVVACVLLLVSEWIGRYAFYASHRRVGL